MTTWLAPALAVIALGLAVLALRGQRRDMARLRRARDVTRATRYQLARELRIAGEANAAHVALAIADELDAALDGRR